MQAELSEVQQLLDRIRDSLSSFKRKLENTRDPKADAVSFSQDLDSLFFGSGEGGLLEAIHKLEEEHDKYAEEADELEGQASEAEERAELAESNLKSMQQEFALFFFEMLSRNSDKTLRQNLEKVLEYILFRSGEVIGPDDLPFRAW